MTPESHRKKLVMAECAALTLATLANLNRANEIEELAGRLWFLETHSVEDQPAIAQRLREAMLAAANLALHAADAVRDLAATLPIQWTDHYDEPEGEPTGGRNASPATG
jgi:hypothetical protein